MSESAAYHLGEVIGVAIGLLLLAGVGVFFVVALVKAFTTRAAGWIVAAVASGVPIAVFLIGMLVAMVVGGIPGYNRGREAAAARRGRPAALLGAEMTPVTGLNVPYEISLPALAAWTQQDARAPFDHLFSYHDAYVAVIAEGVGVGSSERLCEFARHNLEAKTSRCTATAPTRLDINGRAWLTFDAAVTTQGVELKYRFYIYADGEYSIQLITWTGPALFPRYAPVFDRIARTFRLPPPKDEI